MHQQMQLIWVHLSITQFSIVLVLGTRIKTKSIFCRKSPSSTHHNQLEGHPLSPWRKKAQRRDFHNKTKKCATNNWKFKFSHLEAPLSPCTLVCCVQTLTTIFCYHLVVTCNMTLTRVWAESLTANTVKCNACWNFFFFVFFFFLHSSWGPRPLCYHRDGGIII